MLCYLAAEARTLSPWIVFSELHTLLAFADPAYKSEKSLIQRIHPENMN